MRSVRNHIIVVTALVLAGSVSASAQQPAAPAPPPVIPYGTPITLEVAKKAMAAAEAEALKNGWPMAIVILDSTGHTVMLHRLDNTQYGSLAAAEDKARSAVTGALPRCLRIWWRKAA